MKFSLATTFAAFVLGRVAFASPAPIKLHPRLDASQLDVYAPPITYPSAGAVWVVGETYQVTWDASTPPRQITNPHGTLILRKGDLATPLILAKGFNITDGETTITCPWVVDSDDYSLVLMGDSGNWSEQFTIAESDPTDSA
ncbi:hypothetical protein HGRIS_004488 [Hohenbuehelia grisea]|uniref:Yeast cell wall synthesis Kre9/Knh1-like N-terminal domain-containing protein n=1 Tax=Hohenbuehelia grisea TaxID=104357 RepID=A0ABR3JCM8_9AGAR